MRRLFIRESDGVIKYDAMQRFRRGDIDLELLVTLSIASRLHARRINEAVERAMTEPPDPIVIAGARYEYIGPILVKGRWYVPQERM